MESPSPSRQPRITAPGAPAVRAPSPAEWRPLLDWLDRGLRAGQLGRLASEHPLALDPDRPGDHRLVGQRGAYLSHASLTEVRALAPAGALRVGLVGLVYTAPHGRGRGLASRCVEACLEELGRRGVGLALLWSERREFYRRLGFEPLGGETRFEVDAATCTRAGADAAGAVTPLEEGDVAALEALHDRKALRGARPPGSLARLAAAPDTRVLVARRGDEPLGYAALGRGDDFQGVVHEWAGEPPAVLACVGALCEQAGGPLQVLAGSDALPEELAACLDRAGARRRRERFALGRILDPLRLWQELVPGAAAPRLEATNGRLQLRGERHSLGVSPSELQALLFDDAAPRRLLTGWTRDERAALTAALPRPLYLWGFDSF